MKKALIFHGGWEGHQPAVFANWISEVLQKNDFHTDVESSLEVLADVERLKNYDLISPCWTMGQLTGEQSKGLVEAVRGGVGLGGLHGGMGDAFRGDLNYEWMVGGHFVGHPHVGEYTVRIRDSRNAITEGLPEQFAYKSEEYYLLVDPAVEILAEADYTYEGRTCVMPVAWTRFWGKGRVFYSALGHAPSELTEFPESAVLAERGLLWAASVI